MAHRGGLPAYGALMIGNDRMAGTNPEIIAMRPPACGPRDLESSGPKIPATHTMVYILMG